MKLPLKEEVIEKWLYHNAAKLFDKNNHHLIILKLNYLLQQTKKDV
jgi:hypothetical protein